MILRNSFTELVKVLYYTKNLEEALANIHPEATSLSDKIKAFQEFDESDFEEDYEFRQYKRSLLGGHYNNLRWIAHERNQIMHKKGYILSEYLRFQLAVFGALYYFRKASIWMALYWLFFSFLPLLLWLGLMYYFFPFDDFISNIKDGNYAMPIISSLASLFALGIVIRFTEFMQNILIFFDKLRTFTMKYNIFLFFGALIYLLWDISLEDIRKIYNYIDNIAQSITTSSFNDCKNLCNQIILYIKGVFHT